MKASGRALRLLLRSLVVAIAGCGLGAQKPTPAFDARLASSVTATAAEAAVAKPGTKVCRYVQLGIAERDLIRGVVQQEEGESIRVRIEDPGRFPNSLGGTQLARGALVLDKASAWTPCVF
jgi:hypothetical protein